MQKLACVFSYQMSSWVSCQKIVFNLHKAYESDKNNTLLNFNYDPKIQLHEIQKLAHEIFEAKPDAIIILDHKPHPLPLIQFLVNLWQGKKLPKFVFHIFGDFTLYYAQWAKLSALLKGAEVEFFVGSDRQKILIDKFLAPENLSHVCPFPVSKDEFHFDEALREKQRNLWGRSPEDKVMVFTGRLSRQKRIHTLLRTFAAAIEEAKDQKSHLYIYGNPDHIGDPFLGKFETENEYFRYFYRIYKDLPKQIQNRIHFMGSVPNKELKSVYLGADLLVNLSVHNDEDFGMSVAEAQTTGLPSILTDWGGLASFEHPQLPEAVRFIPVSIGESSKTFSRLKVIEEMKKFISTPSHLDRSQLSKLATSKFGIEASAKIIKGVFEKKTNSFTGFNLYFEKVVAKTMLSPRPYLNEKRQVSRLYRELYSAYVRNN